MEFLRLFRHLICLFSAPQLRGQEEKDRASKPSRYVPREEVQKIFARDGECCSYVDPQTGQRCNSKWKLELDHVKPFAHAGENTAKNLRVYYRTHNRRHAVEHGYRKLNIY